MADKSLARKLQIFKPGTFTAMSGGSFSFSDADLEGIAERYDPELSPAPIVVGHPKTDDPAFGWVKGLSFADGHLVADAGEVAPELDEMVAQGHFKKLSASFFSEGAPANPTPGQKCLRHVGLLGAQAPAVPGLKAITEEAFSEGDVISLEFSVEGMALRSIADLFAGFRDWLLANEGQEAADATLPRHRISWLTDLAEMADDEEEAKSKTGAASSFASDGSPDESAASDPETEPEPLSESEFSMPNEDELAKREAEIAAREAALQKQEHTQFVDGLIAKGVSFAAANKDDILALMSAVPADGAIAFADGEQDGPQAALKSLLGKLPVDVALGEHDKGTPPDAAAPLSFASADGGEIDAAKAAHHARAVQYQKDHPGISFADAAIATENA